MKISKLLFCKEELKTNRKKLLVYKVFFAVGVLLSSLYLGASIGSSDGFSAAVISGVCLVLWCGYFFASSIYWLSRYNMETPQSKSTLTP